MIMWESMSEPTLVMTSAELSMIIGASLHCARACVCLLACLLAAIYRKF